MKLTARHLQLIEMLAKGMTNREIALALNITEGTVKQHLFALFKKLKAPNRAKAVILGMQWIQQHGMPMPAVPETTTVTYLKKLVTSVVIVPRNAAPASLEEAALLDHLLAELLAAARPLVQALEGRLTETRRGGIHVSWGMECSHVDDAQRAWLFVRAIHRWLEAESQLTVSLAMDQQEEVHAWTARDAYCSPSYETAWQMAHKTRAATVVVTDRFRNALGNTIPATSSRHGWVLTPATDASAAAVAPGTTQQATAWIEASWRTRTPAWLILRGGTARQRELALQQLAASLTGEGRQCLRLHLPSRASGPALAHALYTQLDAQASLRRRPQSYRALFQHGEVSAEKTVEAVQLLSLRGPLLLSITGHDVVARSQALMQGRSPGEAWPDCPAVCVCADDQSPPHQPLTLTSSTGLVIAWTQPDACTDSENQTAELVQWLDSLAPTMRAELQEWLDHPRSPAAPAQDLPPAPVSPPEAMLDPRDTQHKTGSAALRALLENLVVRPSVSSRHR